MGPILPPWLPPQVPAPGDPDHILFTALEHLLHLRRGSFSPGRSSQVGVCKGSLQVHRVALVGGE